MPTLIDTHVHLSPMRERLIRDLKQRAISRRERRHELGPGQLRAAAGANGFISDAARFPSAGRRTTMPEPGRLTTPYWITSEAEARKAVQELAERKVDIVKIWVDTRDDKYRKLPPEFYGPIIEEAHQRGLRVTVHIFNMEDAKGLMRAGLDAFAHGVRDKDIDDETIAMFKARPNSSSRPTCQIAA